MLPGRPFITTLAALAFRVPLILREHKSGFIFDLETSHIYEIFESTPNSLDYIKITHLGKFGFCPIPYLVGMNCDS